MITAIEGLSFTATAKEAHLWSAYLSALRGGTALIVAFLSLAWLTGCVPRAGSPAVSAESRIPVVGYLAPGSPPPSGFQEAFLEGLRDHGYVPGENIFVEFRFAEEDQTRYPELVADLLSIPVDIIVAPNTPAVNAAKESTKKVPIVTIASGDPVGTGLVASLSRPGGNITGVTMLATDLGAKRLELLREIVPDASRLVCSGTRRIRRRTSSGRRRSGRRKSWGWSSMRSTFDRPGRSSRRSRRQRRSAYRASLS